MGNKGQVLNEAEVDFLLAASAASQEPPPPPPEQRDSQTVTMRGDLEQINLADIFQTLAMSKMEGLLHVRNPLEERQVYCSNGTVRIRVPARLAIRRLGQRLVQAGLLEAEQLRATLVLQRKEPLPLGELLVRQGLLTQEQIDGVAGMQVAEDLFALFTWRHGTFEFYKGEITDPAQRAQFDVCPEFEVNSLLLEVARRSDEWEGILGTIGSLDDVPRRIAEPAEGTELGEAQRALLYGADGHSTYRDLADQTTFPLFEAARAARDLVAAGLLCNLDEDQLVAAATEHATSGQEKRALLLLQTLRDRPGARSLDIVKKMSDALEKAGERRLAGTVLLEAAQQHEDPAEALALARRARDLAPNDAGTISFLRTTLLAHSAPDSAELEKCTVDLLDALIDADLTTTALEIVADARSTGTAQPQILLREAKARQKARDTQGAVEVLLELAKQYTERGERQRAIETYDAVLRLDRSRKDIQKLVSQMRQTRLGRIVRLTAMVAGVVLLGGMGFVFWQQSSFEAAAKAADAEVTARLDIGDRNGAREVLAQWHERLGDCEPIEDLRSRIDFAEAAEKTKLEKLVRKAVNDSLQRAADTLDKGEVREAFGIYLGVWKKPPFREEVEGIVKTRVDAILTAVEQAGKGMAHSMPPEPSSLFDRKDLNQGFADLQSVCPPKLLRTFHDLSQMVDAREMPECLDAELTERVGNSVKQHKPLFARAAELTQAYTEAMQRNEHQRRLDPMFKAAVERERVFDFRGALDLYKKLESEPASDEQLRAHFRDQVAKNTKICAMIEAVQKATENGEAEVAQTQFRALRVAFPNVPFDRLVRLPLRIASRPKGAKVVCNGTDLGKAPLVLSYLPAEQTKIALSMPGYRGTEIVVTGDGRSEWIGNLICEPRQILAFDNVVDAAPADDGNGGLVFVDRGGVVTSIRRDGGDVAWKFPTGDLSGLLARPLVRGNEILVASLDGELRALDRGKGTVVWSRPDLVVEVAPSLVDKFLVVATTDRKLRVVDVVERTEVVVTLPENACDQVVVHGKTVAVLDSRGTVSAFALPGVTRAWQTSLADMTQPWMVRVDGSLVVADDAGHVACLDLGDGRIRWTKALAAEVLGRPAATGDTVWLASPDRISRLDLRTGNALPVIARGDQAWAGGAVSVGNRLLVPIADGSVQVLDPSTDEWLYRLDGSKRGGKVLAAGSMVFVVQADRRVHCFDQLP